MPGRKPVPLGLNRMHMTKEQREKRESAEAMLSGATDKIIPPAWLDKIAKTEFRRLAVELIGLKIICNADVGGLAIACDAYRKYIMATAAITEQSINVEIVKSDGTITAKKNPLNAVEKYATIYRQYCAEFGLTPAARIKLSANIVTREEQDPEDAAMNELEKRRQANQKK